VTGIAPEESRRTRHLDGSIIDDAARRTSASYGVDAPGFFPFALLGLMVSLFAAITSHKPGPCVGAAVILVCVGFFLHTTRRGKFIVWQRVLGDLRLRGDERILDLGCGRGAVLLLAAKRLTTGHAIGVDIWSSVDQLGNSPRAALANAELEGVQDRVELATADMTALPFSSAAFDVIVSNVAIHNIKGLRRRLIALDEAVRVLRPGGRLLIADLRSTSAYVARLESLGMIDIRRRNLGWRMWWGGPWGATRLVTAMKASDARTRCEWIEEAVAQVKQSMSKSSNETIPE
jgi:ubiquinone/menaquinone biosynthesis C-methylase UbiE